jgi:hypothetical protein
MSAVLESPKRPFLSSRNSFHQLPLTLDKQFSNDFEGVNGRRRHLSAEMCRGLPVYDSNTTSQNAFCTAESKAKFPKSSDNQLSTKLYDPQLSAELKTRHCIQPNFARDSDCFLGANQQHEQISHCADKVQPINSSILDGLCRFRDSPVVSLIVDQSTMVWSDIVPAGLHSSTFYTQEFQQDLRLVENSTASSGSPAVSPADASLVFSHSHAQIDSNSNKRSCCVQIVDEEPCITVMSQSRTISSVEHKCPHCQSKIAPAGLPLHPTRISFILAETQGDTNRFFIPKLAAGAIEQGIWIQNAEATYSDVNINDTSVFPLHSLAGDAKKQSDLCAGDQHIAASNEADAIHLLCVQNGGSGRAIRVSCMVDLPVLVTAAPILKMPQSPEVHPSDSSVDPLEWC